MEGRRLSGLLALLLVALGAGSSSPVDGWVEQSTLATSQPEAALATPAAKSSTLEEVPLKHAEDNCHVSCTADQSKHWLEKCGLTRCSACGACHKSISDLLQTQAQAGGGDIQLGGLGVHVSPKLVILFPLALATFFGMIFLLVSDI